MSVITRPSRFHILSSTSSPAGGARLLAVLVAHDVDVVDSTSGTFLRTPQGSRALGTRAASVVIVVAVPRFLLSTSGSRPDPTVSALETLRPNSSSTFSPVDAHLARRRGEAAQGHRPCSRRGQADETKLPSASVTVERVLTSS
jgi:hypothetical protein